MKVVRFMSEAEKELYLSGARMMNGKVHSDDGYATSSVGFCFAELTDKRDADKWLLKLMFNTKCEYCVEFDTDKLVVPLTESYARYAGDTDFSRNVTFREWCTMEYSMATHPYERIGKCPNIYEIAKGKKIVWESSDL